MRLGAMPAVPCTETPYERRLRMTTLEMFRKLFEAVGVEAAALSENKLISSDQLIDIACEAARKQRAERDEAAACAEALKRRYEELKGQLFGLVPAVAELSERAVSLRAEERVAHIRNLGDLFHSAMHQVGCGLYKARFRELADAYAEATGFRATVLVVREPAVEPAHAEAS